MGNSDLLSIYLWGKHEITVTGERGTSPHLQPMDSFAGGSPALGDQVDQGGSAFIGAAQGLPMGLGEQMAVYRCSAQHRPSLLAFGARKGLDTGCREEGESSLLSAGWPTPPLHLPLPGQKAAQSLLVWTLSPEALT